MQSGELDEPHDGHRRDHRWASFMRGDGGPGSDPPRPGRLSPPRPGRAKESLFLAGKHAFHSPTDSQSVALDWYINNLTIARWALGCTEVDIDVHNLA